MWYVIHQPHGGKKYLKPLYLGGKKHTHTCRTHICIASNIRDQKWENLGQPLQCKHLCLRNICTNTHSDCVWLLSSWASLLEYLIAKKCLVMKPDKGSTKFVWLCFWVFERWGVGRLLPSHLIQNRHRPLAPATPAVSGAKESRQRRTTIHTYEQI